MELSPSASRGSLASFNIYKIKKSIIAKTSDTQTANTANDKAASAKSEKDPLFPFLEVQYAKVSTRYNFVANDRGVTTKNHQQHKEAFNFRIRFDKEARYTLNAAAGSGTGFTSSWDAMGIGSDASSNLNFRELYLLLKPWKGIDLQYGGVTAIRGTATEITTFDNDSYLMGARLVLKDPGRSFFDEIAGTLVYLGDFNEPDVFRRFDCLNEANYHQILLSKKIGKCATVSGEYASQSGVASLRQAVQVKLPEIKAIGSVRFENYQRIEGKKDYGYAVQADKKIHKMITLSQADRLNAASGEINTASQSLASGATQQASSLEEISSSLHVMKSVTGKNSQNAQEARALTLNSRKSAERGKESMENLSAVMAGIKVSADSTARIMKTIDDIAFQTNLLALNAAVEAARTGESGKGFAVVAEKERSLVMRCAEAARNTAAMIEESVAKATAGVQVNEEVSQNLSEILTHVRHASDMMEEIVAASEDQKAGITQIATAIEQMEKTTQQAAASSEETASGAEELASQARDMKSTVGRFKLDDPGLAGTGLGDIGKPNVLSNPSGRTHKNAFHLPA